MIKLIESYSQISQCYKISWLKPVAHHRQRNGGQGNRQQSTLLSVHSPIKHPQNRAAKDAKHQLQHPRSDSLSLKNRSPSSDGTHESPCVRTSSLSSCFRFLTIPLLMQKETNEPLLKRNCYKHTCKRPLEVEKPGNKPLVDNKNLLVSNLVRVLMRNSRWLMRNLVVEQLDLLSNS